MTQVKICGITTLQDALTAVDLGADMLGFNFYTQSKRYITPKNCRSIIHGLQAASRPPIHIGVFVNASYDEITNIMDICSLDLAQLSGDEPIELLESLGSRAFKAIRPRTINELNNTILTLPHRSQPPAYLIDAFHPNEYGGTGLTTDWDAAQKLASRFPILLAGGLTPQNVAQAVQIVSPWGVDVASGVESSPGIKDHAKMKQFIQNAKMIHNHLPKKEL